MPEQTLVKWNEETILEHLKKIAKEQLNLTPEQIETIGPSVSLVDALQLDSLAQVVLVTTIEQDFGCAFGLEQWQELQTVQDLVKMIASRVCEPEPQA
jgi:acyl carrier protein